MVNGVIRRGKDDLHLFGTVGLGSCNSFSITLKGKKMNVSLLSENLKIRRIKEFRGSDSITIGISITLINSRDTELALIKDGNHFYLFGSDNQSVIRGSSEYHSKVKGEEVIKVNFYPMNNKVEVCRT
jgi:hypothetical protein